MDFPKTRYIEEAPKSWITGDEKDAETLIPQIHIVDELTELIEE